MDDGVLEAVALRWVRRICDRPLPAGLEGVYDAERDEIVLSDRLSPIQRRCVLAHEISHARHHDVGGHGDAVTERRADIDAARILIDMGEYVTAEIVYGGDVCAMARELTVMPRTVRAYREWLHDNAAIHR